MSNLTTLMFEEVDPFKGYLFILAVPENSGKIAVFWFYVDRTGKLLHQSYETHMIKLPQDSEPNTLLKYFVKIYLPAIVSRITEITKIQQFAPKNIERWAELLHERFFNGIYRNELQIIYEKTENEELKAVLWKILNGGQMPGERNI